MVKVGALLFNQMDNAISHEFAIFRGIAAQGWDILGQIQKDGTWVSCTFPYRFCSRHSTS